MSVMRRIYAYILTVICLISGLRVLAQTDISLATHWYNRANYNPAFIARTDYLYLFCNTRHQWIGVNGAPAVLNVQVSEYYDAIHSAFGLSFVNDKIGITQSFNPMLTYAFRIAKKNKWALSMGLSGGMFIRTIDGSKLEAETAGDPSLFYYYKKISKPDFNTGFEFQTPHFITGISSTHLTSIGKSDTMFLNTNHRYAYVIYKNDDPRILSYSFGAEIVNRYNLTVVEGNVFVRVKRPSKMITGPLNKGPQEILDFGLTYRTSREVTLLCGVMISPYFRIGYAYDQSLLSQYGRYGTHEVMLEYRIPAKSASTQVRCGGKEFWYR
jgi:type IX secretion system PorP/SprF family membrane protein